MVLKSDIVKQLKTINYKIGFFNNAEINELSNVIMPGEVIYECLNGFYEGGYALLTITNERLLLVDKKPFNFLTIEDVRFSQVNQIFYNNRFIGSSLFVNLGMRNLKFTSYNKSKLRNLVTQLQILISKSKQQLIPQQNNEQQDSLDNLNQKLDQYISSYNSSHPSQVSDIPIVKTDDQQVVGDIFGKTYSVHELRLFGRKQIEKQRNLSFRNNNHFFKDTFASLTEKRRRIVLFLGSVSLTH
jgi:hypothetical protein